MCGGSHSPSTVRKALVVLTGMVKSEQVYWPSSDRLTSLILIVSSCHDARTSSILWSLRAAWQTGKKREKTHRNEWIITVWQKSVAATVAALVSDAFVVQTTFSMGKGERDQRAFSHFKCVTHAANARCASDALNIFFFFFCILHLHSRSTPAYLQSARTETTPRDALKCVRREKPLDYNIHWGNRSHSRYSFALNWILIAAAQSVRFPI